MTNDEKQALIKFIQREKVTCAELDTRDFVEPEMDDFMRYGAILEIALATLTAQPVKLPPGRLMQVAFETDPVNADMYLCISRDGAVAAIREAGYEVQE